MRKAKKHTVAFIRNAKKIVLTYDNSNLYDRYGRLLASIYVNNESLSDSLIKSGLGRNYHGGKRQSWCE